MKCSCVILCMFHTFYISRECDSEKNSRGFYFRETSAKFCENNGEYWCRLIMPQSRILTSQICILTLFAKLKFLQKILNAFVLLALSGKYRLTPGSAPQNCKKSRCTHTNVYAVFDKFIVIYCEKRSFGEKRNIFRIIFSFTENIWSPYWHPLLIQLPLSYLQIYLLFCEQRLYSNRIYLR